MEPERNIEKELKAYAQQRRAEAGAPTELHPATRKLLQDEAARSAKNADGVTRSGGQTFWGSWPRLAVAGMATVAVVVGCWVLFPGFSKSKMETSRPSMEMARNREDFKEQPADRSKAADQEKKMMTHRSLATAKSSPAITDVDSLHLNTVAAPVAATPPPPAPMAAPSAPAPEIRTFAPAKKDSLGLGGIGGTAAPASTDKFYALYPADVPVTPVIQRFRRTGQNASQSADIGGNANVLVNFKVEETRNGLRIIDSDGSIYNGFVSRTPKAAREPVEAVKKALAQDNAAPAAETQKQPLRIFSFRVSGTNRTLKQEVVFTGNFLTAAEALAAPVSAGELIVTNAPLSGGAGGAGDFLLPLELQKVSLEGRVLVDRTNKMEIEAAPVKP